MRVQESDESLNKSGHFIQDLGDDGVVAVAVAAAFCILFIGFALSVIFSEPGVIGVAVLVTIVCCGLFLLQANLVLGPIRKAKRAQKKERERDVERRKFYEKSWAKSEAERQVQTYKDELDYRYINNKPSCYGLPLTDSELQERIEYLHAKLQCSKETLNNPSPGAIQLGTRQVQGAVEPVQLPEAVRDRDVYIVGKKRSGKSTVLFNMSRQDIEQGRGVAIIDAHGDLVEDVVAYIPKGRVQDTIYFDASDKNLLISLNIFNAQDEREIALLADDLLILFRRLSTGWGERMEYILRYTFHTLLRAKGTTFLDIQRILQDATYRKEILLQINDEHLLEFWQEQFPRLPKGATQPIISRMSDFILSPVLSAVLGKSESALDFYDLMQEKRIFLAKIAKGEIGADTSHILGSLLVSQFQLATMRRAKISREEREFYFLYVDEFQNFTSSAFEEILSEAGKYKLSLTIAHQFISQLDERLRDAILGNVGNIVMLPVSEKDANHLKGVLAPYPPEYLMNLNTHLHEALCKLDGVQQTFLYNTLARPPLPLEMYVQEIMEHTRASYVLRAVQPQKPGLAQEQAAASIEESPSASPILARPQRSEVTPDSPKAFARSQDKILYFVELAQYLSTKQIIALCYSHLAKSAQATTASRDLRALVGDKKIKCQMFGKAKVYHTARACNPTAHNLAVRDLFVKIVRSEYEIAEVNFFTDLQNLHPDLFVSFLAQDGSLIKSFWEYDTGTEIVGEIINKVERYKLNSADHLITFVVATPERLSQLRTAIEEPFVTLACISEFETLNDQAFHSSERDQPFSFFL